MFWFYKFTVVPKSEVPTESLNLASRLSNCIQFCPIFRSILLLHLPFLQAHLSENKQTIKAIVSPYKLPWGWDGLLSEPTGAHPGVSLSQRTPYGLHSKVQEKGAKTRSTSQGIKKKLSCAANLSLSQPGAACWLHLSPQISDPKPRIIWCNMTPDSTSSLGLGCLLYLDSD